VVEGSVLYYPSIVIMTGVDMFFASEKLGGVVYAGYLSVPSPLFVLALKTEGLGC
jgi:hypothetical protein